VCERGHGAPQQLGALRDQLPHALPRHAQRRRQLLQLGLDARGRLAQQVWPRPQHAHSIKPAAAQHLRQARHVRLQLGQRHAQQLRGGRTQQLRGLLRRQLQCGRDQAQPRRQRVRRLQQQRLVPRDQQHHQAEVQRERGRDVLQLLRDCRRQREAAAQQRSA
jgi:hypothetical protein